MTCGIGIAGEGPGGPSPVIRATLKQAQVILDEHVRGSEEPVGGPINLDNSWVTMAQ